MRRGAHCCRATTPPGREGQGCPVGTGEVVGLPGAAVQLVPLVEAVGWDEDAVAAKAVRKEALVATVSPRALKRRLPAGGVLGP